MNEKKTIRTEALKRNLTVRLNRIEGQVRGLNRQVQKDAYCDDVLNQIAAVRSALQSVSRLVLENHLRNCLVRDIKNDQNEIIDELLETIDKMTKRA